MKVWLFKWGPWVGSAIVVLLALSSRWEGYTWTKGQQDAYAEGNRLRIVAIEKRLELMDKWVDEHKQVTTSRIAQLESLDRDSAVTREAIATIKADLQEIKLDVRDLREHAGIHRAGDGRAK